MTRRHSVGIAVLTYRARKHLHRCLSPLQASVLDPQILVVDSSSDDGTVEEAKRLGADTLAVSRHEFNHGATRELARRRLGTDVVVMVSQDAYARDVDALDRLVEPILTGDASVAYGRQVPRPGAGTFESFLRAFNYPPSSNIRGLADAPRYGAALFFCSNAFAAWSQAALDQVGGFPTTLSHEDAIAAALLLKGGHRIAYVAEAVVEHSHPYGLISDFRRYFDAGYARAEFAQQLALGGTHAALGARYARVLFGDLAGSRPWLIPYATAHLLAKGLGYFAGARAVGETRWIARWLSGQDYFWDSAHYRRSSPRPARRP
jgi:rhamnosyltransferase